MSITWKCEKRAGFAWRFGRERRPVVAWSWVWWRLWSPRSLAKRRSGGRTWRRTFFGGKFFGGFWNFVFLGGVLGFRGVLHSHLVLFPVYEFVRESHWFLTSCTSLWHVAIDLTWPYLLALTLWFQVFFFTLHYWLIYKSIKAKQ